LANLHADRPAPVPAVSTVAPIGADHAAEPHRRAVRVGGDEFAVLDREPAQPAPVRARLAPLADDAAEVGFVAVVVEREQVAALVLAELGKATTGRAGRPCVAAVACRPWLT